MKLFTLVKQSLAESSLNICPTFLLSNFNRAFWQALKFILVCDKLKLTGLALFSKW
jgi:hypothetical protein